MIELQRLDVKFLPGVGPARAKLLESELKVRTFHDLLYTFPFRHIDRSTVYRIADLGTAQAGDMPSVQLRGRFVAFNVMGEGAKRRLVGLFGDGTGTIEVVWFRQIRSIQNAYHVGVEYLLYGKPAKFGHSWSMTHPEVDQYKPETAPQGLMGVYSLTEKMRNRGLNSRAMQRLVANLLASPAFQRLPETLPPQLTQRHRLVPLQQALRAMHMPGSLQELQQAQRRLKYEELFFLELNILKTYSRRNAQLKGHVFAHIGEAFNGFYQRGLAFPLTGAQKRVIREIRADMCSGRQMNRLLQGDVGSGKTIVAFLTMLIAVDNGFQACLMAPTEILATQHAQGIAEMAAVVGVKVALLKGSTRKKERERIHAQLLSGELQILIGTHALIEDTVQFANLGLAVIDEQHRFGVQQRARLWGKNSVPPHVLVMTATPIPRTLSMTVYGDLDVSIINELPPGRKPVTTTLRYEKDRHDVYSFVYQELRKGRQVYIVYPLIEENEKLDLKALEEGYESVREVFGPYKVCCVHGKMKPAEKDYQMQLFASGEARIMVATTVIEVGVNVPNASVMIIENAERFGLSQLHQLRGRVGRGADQSFCILMSKVQLARDTRHRLEVMTSTNDGFVVAEEDMKLRGPGDIEGTMQSGIAFTLKAANLATDGPIVEAARRDVEQILEADPNLSTPMGRMLDQHRGELYDHQVNWGMIS